MSIYLTSDTLIESIKRRASIPSNQVTFLDADFLAFANEEMMVGLVPSILSVHEEYFVWSEEVPLVSGVSQYAIPYRAIGQKLRDVFYKDSNGNLFEMTRISPDNKSFFQGSQVISQLTTYYIQGNNIVMTPDVGTSATGSLVLTYYLRPSELVAESRVGIISSITVGASTTDFVVSSAGIPPSLTTSVYCDFYQARPGHKMRVFDILPSAVNTSTRTITFTNTDLPSGANAIVVGDHLSLASECMIPMIPTELHSVLAQRVAARCVESMGDQAGLQAINLKLAEMENKTQSLIDNRVEGSPIKLVNYRNILRTSKIGRRRWGM